MKKKILLDVDGVLGDFHGAANKLIFDLFKLDIKPEKFITWDVTDVLESKEMKDDLNHEITKPGFCSSIEPYQEAMEAVRQLREIGTCEIVFVTSPNKNGIQWVHERDAWLIKHFEAKYEEIIHVYNKRLVSGNLLIDDKPKNIEEWTTANPQGKALLWDQPYNKYSSLERVDNWNDIVDLIEEKKPPHFTCHYCGLHDENVECGGIYYCPNPLCLGPGAAYFRSKMKSYEESENGKHSVNPSEIIMFGEWLLNGDIPDKMKIAISKSIKCLLHFEDEESVKDIIDC